MFSRKSLNVFQLFLTQSIGFRVSKEKMRMKMEEARWCRRSNLLREPVVTSDLLPVSTRSEEKPLSAPDHCASNLSKHLLSR